VSWFVLQLLSETFLILKRIQRDMIKNVLRSSCKVPFILVRFSRNLNFFHRFSKNTQISNFMLIRTLGEESHADRRTDRHDYANCLFSLDPHRNENARQFRRCTVNTKFNGNPVRDLWHATDWQTNTMQCCLYILHWLREGRVNVRETPFSINHT
jgi:hypothetical protein